MKAIQILKEKNVIAELVIEIAVWQVPAPIPACQHEYKYRLYCERAGQCIVRYDNERGKGDHVHYATGEIPYRFISLERLIADFEADIQRLARGGS